MGCRFSGDVGICFAPRMQDGVRFCCICFFGRGSELWDRTLTIGPDRTGPAKHLEQSRPTGHAGIRGRRSVEDFRRLFIGAAAKGAAVVGALAIEERIYGQESSWALVPQWVSAVTLGLKDDGYS
jgi:hypothetical protein